jgi:hypothetical protein
MSSTAGHLAVATPELLEVVRRIADGERSDDGHTAVRDAARSALHLVEHGSSQVGQAQ